MEASSSTSSTSNPELSERERADGNVAFKQGRWIRALGHYTKAIVANPNVAAAYTNRAAAYLKLEKYIDADRDCTKALTLQKTSVKALYRRAVARKSMDLLQEALNDLEAALKIEKGNETVTMEIAEVKSLMKAKENRSKARVEVRNRVLRTEPGLTATIEEIQEPAPSPEESVPLPTLGGQGAVSAEQGSATLAIPEVPNPSFAELRKTRDQKKFYVNTDAAASNSTQATPPQSGIPGVDDSSPVSVRNQKRPRRLSSTATSRSDISAKLAAPDSSPESQGKTRSTTPPILSKSSKPSTTEEDTSKTPKKTGPDSQIESESEVTPVPAKPSDLPKVDPTSPTKPTQPTPPKPSPPRDPASTAAGTGLQLLRRIQNTSPASGWKEISYYAAHVIPTILNVLLEPDTLGQILVALRYGVDENPQKVGVILAGLKSTQRWKMNVVMLNKSERLAGDQAWTLSQANGVWP